MPDTEADVIIVGGGPVGLSLACELSYRGIKTILLERGVKTATIAKAFALNSRSMEHFRRIGVEEKIQNSSFPRDLPFRFGMYTSLLDGSTIINVKFASWGEIADGELEKRYPLFEPEASPSVPMFCPQSTSEPVLKEHLETTSQCVTVLFGHQVTSITQDDNEVIVKANLPADKAGSSEEKQQVYKAKYLVACDGGSSTSRKLFGIHTFGSFVVARACSIMIQSPEMYQRIRDEGKAGMAAISNMNLFGLVITANATGGLVVHVFLPSTASDEEINSLVQDPIGTVRRMIGSSLPFTVTAVSGYNMHALVSTKFREGRCLFAGDSAHQWLPAGGLGLNTGISDTADLAWKLEAVLKGYGGSDLLDSYQEERRPVVESTKRYALALGRFLLSDSALVIGVRKLVLSVPIIRTILGRVFESVSLPALTDSNQVVLGFQYSNSSIIMHEYDKNGDVLRLTHKPFSLYPSLPGCRAPHVVLPDSASILDLFGKTFVLLIIGGEETDLKALRDEMTNRGVPFQVYAYPKLPDLVASYDRKYFLVRPDGVICWRSDIQPSSLESRKITATVVGDAPKKRLPWSIWSAVSQPIRSHFRGVLVDILSWVGIEMVMSYLQFGATPTHAVSFTYALMSRALRTSPPVESIQQTSRHRAVVLKEFGSADAVLKVVDRHVGTFGTKDVLIRVHAASINPVDCRMRFGYGSGALAKAAAQARRNLFPLVLGRDCSGEVVAVGDEVTKFLPGDHVFAAVSPYRQGTYAQLVAVHEGHVAFKPSNVDHKEAASLPWVACTTWSALVKNAGLNKYNTRGKKVLVHGGTGGVGSFAVQLLKAWGAEVTVTCSTQNVTLAHHLGADKAFDYTTGDFSSAFKGYDIVLDAAGSECEGKTMSVLKCFGGAKYISLISPEVFYTGKLGSVVGGVVFSWLYRFKIFSHRLFFGRAIYYTKAAPDGECLEEVCKMVEKGEIRPLIEAVYSIDEIVDAHKHVEAGHSRGKVVIAVP